MVVKIPPSQSVTHCLPRRTKGIIRRGKARKALWVTIKTFLIVRKKKKSGDAKAILTTSHKQTNLQLV